MRNKIILLIFIAVLSLLVSLTIGAANISIADFFRIIGYKVLNINLPEEFERVNVGLIWNIRLPRVLLSFIVGAALAVSGSVKQSVLKNPLASSYTVGVSAGAGLGAVVLITMGTAFSALGFLLIPAITIIFAMATIVCAVLFASKISHDLNDQSIVLVGMVISIFINALMMTIATHNPTHAQQIALWQLGSFSLKGWTVTGIVFFSSLALILWLCRYTKELDILTFGDEQANTIGIDVKKTKWTLLLSSAMLTAISVSFVGIIGFVDLISPHIIRRLFGAAHRYVIPLSAIFGGTFMVLADLVSRTAMLPSEIPIGSVTALVGAPFFGYLFLKNRQMKVGDQ